MFDQKKYEGALAAFKQDFVGRQWPNEKYKWEAIQWFQDHWDVNAPDFAAMLNTSLKKTYNLLASMNNYPRRMIEKFAQEAPEAVRAMFIALFDETSDLWSRIDAFKQKAAALRDRLRPDAGQHYQNENAIMTYLWLRYPDRYYIFKLSEIKATNKALGGSYAFKQGDYAGNIRSFMAFYDEICEALKQDYELDMMFNSHLTAECYSDPKFKTMTQTFGFYISRFYTEESASAVEEEWFPSGYSPELSVDQWVTLLKDETVFTPDSLAIMKRFKDYGGAATCTQLAVKYGESKNFYNSGSSFLAKRIAEKTGCPVMPRDSDNSRWWPILYLGRKADKSIDHGVYIWKLRDELAQALDRVDLSDIPLYVTADEEETDRQYWWLNANPRIWSFSSIAVGEAQDYTLYNENGNKRRIFQNFLDARVGDMIVCYESHPVKQVVGLARVVAEQDGEKLTFEKLEGFAEPIDLATLKSCPELEHMEYFTNAQGSLFKLTRGEFDFIMDLVREENPAAVAKAADIYDKAAFLRDMHLSEARYDRLKAVLLRKKNIILQGAPGVGKTFAARRLAWSIMGEQDDSRIEFVQFHQNYSYEDFVMGYKPEDSGFALKTGVFHRFCQRANNRPELPHFFIIDEINRGNLSRIFGELLMLIEPDYRDAKVKLAYSDVPFSVPGNLYIIGMMNTADRSLALIDYALRRRFSFFDMEPGFDSEGFRRYQAGLENETFDALIERIRELNREIAQDKALGRGFCIGHSYFCGLKGPEDCTVEWMRDVVDYDILQMLGEYWFDDEAKLQRWENSLHGVFQ